MRRVGFKASLLGMLLGAAALVGCDAQQGPAYKGEPLATLRGEITSARTSVPDSEVALVWSITEGSPDTVIVEPTPVTGSFPAAFKLDIMGPPPSGAVSPSESGDGSYGIAYIGVFEKGKPHTLENLLGGAPSHVIVYIEDAFPAETEAATWIGNARTKGYHLMRATPPDPSLSGAEDYDGTWDMVEEPNGFDTVIPVSLPADPAEFAFPNVD